MKPTKKSLEQKIKAVNKIAKITRAMKIIAAMKYQKLVKRTVNTTTLISDLQTVFAALQPQPTKALMSAKPIRVVVLITSDIGLCGSYNSNVLGFYKINPAAQLFVIGKKGINYLRYRRVQPVFTTSQATFTDLVNQTQLIKQLVALTQKPNHKIEIIYTHPISVTRFVVQKLVLWPVLRSTTFSVSKIATTAQNTKLEESRQFTIEPKRAVVLKNQLPFYLQTILQACLLLAELTEQATRQRVMESANDNALKMVKDLKLKYNQIRQEKITNEILEISRE